jgi:hypothetical protein
MVERLRREDSPMHFYKTLDQMPGYVGVGLPPAEVPPAEATRVDNILELSAMEGWNGVKIEPGPEHRMMTLPSPGAFCGYIPVHHAGTIKGPCWVQLRLRVLSGRIGFQAFNSRTGGLAQTLGIGAAREPQTVVLRVPDFRSATGIIITNETSTRSQVEVLDAALLVPR